MIYFIHHLIRAELSSVATIGILLLIDLSDGFICRLHFLLNGLEVDMIDSTSAGDTRWPEALSFLWGDILIDGENRQEVNV